MVVRQRYLGAPGATAQAWRNGWFHTGDIMRKSPDGNFYYVDRGKDMIRRRGENIASAELEVAILKHPDVSEAAVIGIGSALGDEDILAAIVAPRTAFRAEDLLALLLDIVTRYAVPRYVRVVETLPRTQATQREENHGPRAQGVTPECPDLEPKRER